MTDDEKFAAWAGGIQVVQPENPAEEEVPVTFYVLRERGGPEARGDLLYRTEDGWGPSWEDAYRYPTLEHARAVLARIRVGSCEIRRIVLRSEAVCSGII